MGVRSPVRPAEECYPYPQVVGNGNNAPEVVPSPEPKQTCEYRAVHQTEPYPQVPPPHYQHEPYVKPPKKENMSKKRKWTIGLMALLLVVIGAVVGGVVGGLAQRHVSSKTSTSPNASGSTNPSTTPSQGAPPTSTLTGTSISWTQDSNKKTFIFSLEQDKHVYYKSGNSDTWDDNWSQLGNTGPDNVSVFVLGTDSGVWTIAYDGTRDSPWDSNWTTLGGSFVKLPSVASWGEKRFDLFGIESDASGGNMMHKAWGGDKRQQVWDAGWSQIGNCTFDETPSVVSWGPNRLDMIGMNNGMLLVSNWVPQAWGTWWMVSEGWQHSPVLTSRGEGLLDIWVLDGSNALHHEQYDEEEHKRES
ncbi:hypothetical protein BCR34DRAFT_583679 [Clohesyomyces aquaticus]|uniref:Fucose-specific lectin n=1 Tax=Clohesyomyces aquaticus TaxID=1231657 RepID=A0A1Y2A3Y6_9PLEO|nr:hypothetical protein BCR34DRAFT_583679 [Clohesyomyces aquaticus]